MGYIIFGLFIVFVLYVIGNSKTKDSFKESDIKEKEYLNSVDDLETFITNYKNEVSKLINTPEECKKYVSNSAKNIKIIGRSFGLVKLATLWGGEERLKNAIPEAICKRGSGISDGNKLTYKDLIIETNEYNYFDRDLSEEYPSERGWQWLTIKNRDKVVFKVSADFSTPFSYIDEKLFGDVEIFKPEKWILIVNDLYKKIVREKIDEEIRAEENKKKTAKKNYLE